MSAVELRRPRHRKPEVNIVPLVDVLIVLIFFFLLTMKLDEGDVRALNITPPKVETAGENEVADNIIIAVDAQGAYFYNNSPVTEDELSDLIATAAGFSREQDILVVADEDTPLKKVTFVMDRARKVGLESLRLQTR